MSPRPSTIVDTASHATRLWALVPARGGSKSVRHKNLHPLAGLPLMDYGIRAAQHSALFERIICSTEDDSIAEQAESLGIEIDHRPAELATDDAKVADVAMEMLVRLAAGQARLLPDILVLVQPTSPFLLPRHLSELIAAMRADPDAQSGQTVAHCPHNHHAWNQRVVADGRVQFRYRDERRSAFNKQSKPVHHVFGNLVAVRSDAILRGEDFFAEPSVAVEIPWPFDLDVDTADDFKLAEALLRGGLVELDHLKGVSA